MSLINEVKIAAKTAALGLLAAGLQATRERRLS